MERPQGKFYGPMTLGRSTVLLGYFLLTYIEIEVGSQLAFMIKKRKMFKCKLFLYISILKLIFTILKLLCVLVELE